MNSVAAGLEHERRVLTHLRLEEHKVHRTTRTSRQRRGGRWMSQSNDIFGCIDILAKRAGERMRYIQVTSGSGDIGRKKAKLSRIPWDTQYESVEIWRWVSGKGKKLDDRTGKPSPRMYFQIYRLDKGFVLDKSDRIWPKSN